MFVWAAKDNYGRNNGQSLWLNGGVIHNVW